MLLFEKPSAFLRVALLVSIASSIPVSAQATTVGPLQPLGGAPATAAQRAPVVSWDGTRYVVVWEDTRAAASGIDLYLARISAAGVVLDGNGLAVLTPAQNGDQTQPAIGYDSAAGHHLISWIDARSGGAEVYAGRFTSAAGGSFLDPSGRALTNSAGASESRPALACAAQSCLVAFQETAAGTVQLRGVRVYPAGTLLDASPIDLVADDTGRLTELGPSVTATGSTFFVAWEDDRSRATGLLGAEIYGRTVPDVGNVSPVVGSLLASGDYRQAFPSLGMITATQVLAVWQDQRSGPTSANAEDIWSARFGVTLAPSGAASLFAGATRPQLLPRLAGGAGRGLVVWQDFRSGTFGLTYAARVDATGRSLDGAGFPVVALNANVIEHAVAKGPGADYLVVSVRSTPAPARLFYRIVRDEPPSGALTGTGDARGPADGAATLGVTFGPARGASGLPVIDGTLYTVTVSRSDVTVEPSDADPSIAGHQLAASNGQIAVSLRSLRPGAATVSLSSTEGSSTGSFAVTFDNVPPTVRDVRVSPPMPTSDDDLVLSYVYEDINGDLEGPTQISWTRNAALQAGLDGARRVPGNLTFRGDTWRALVRPHDGTSSAATTSFSNTVVIGNTPPEATAVRIDPSMDVKTGTPLRARYTFRDADGDTERNSVLRWYQAGVEQPALADQETVPGALVSKGQTWRFTIVPNDGTTTGALVSSATVAIQNSVPSADAGDRGEVVERRPFMLDGTGSSDADPGDVLAFTWRQIDGPAVDLSDPSDASPSFTAPSVLGATTLVFGLTVDDGEDSSEEARAIVLVTAVPDQDADGLDDEEEALAQTDPARPDTDRDGLVDGAEVQGGTDPNDEDSDDDGVRDGAEILPFEDTDGDLAINARDHDSDGDGIADGTELGVTTPPAGTDLAAGLFVADADPTTTTDPTNADTDGDMIADGVEDANRNGRVDLGESDPNDPTSTVGCSPERTCPSPLACIQDACRSPGGADGGQCVALETRGLECCSGGCSGGESVAPVCLAAGRSEQCPLGATECRSGSCSVESAQRPPADGCGCAASGDGGAQSWLMLLGLAIVIAARRNGSSRPSRR